MIHPIPSGTRDVLPEETREVRAITSTLLSVFERHGYGEVYTPALEYESVLTRADMADAEPAYRVFDETGAVLVLRSDMTAPIARVVATRYANSEPPLRFCYFAHCYRGVPPQRGQQRELLQAGIELIDAPEPDGDAEVLAVTAAALAATRLPEIRLDIGHVAPARHVLGAVPGAAAGPTQTSKLHNGDARARLAGALARKDRAGVRSAARVLPATIASLAEALVTLWGPAEATLDRAAQLAWPDDVHATLARLRSVVVALGEIADPPAPAVTIDLGDLRGFDYYTGVRFAGYAGGAPDAVLRGGRYDELIGRYGRPAHATGFAIDLEAVAEAQRAAGVPAPAIALGVAVHGGGASRIARSLRSRGLRAVTAVERPTPAWLRGAGLDAGLVVDGGGRRELVLADDSRRDIEAAVSSLMEE